MTQRTFDLEPIVLAENTLYENTYGGYIDLFKMLATSDVAFECENVPLCWGPLITYLGHVVMSTKFYADIDPVKVDWVEQMVRAEDPRHVVEIAAACRPELVHALYLIDTEWHCKHKLAGLRDEFIVTTNASFFRPEVVRYFELLRSFQPAAENCVIVPCAADKPYPSPLHKAVKARIPEGESWELIVVTGVLGLVPEALWPNAPAYDAGIPNFQRVEETVAWYFTRHHYERVLVYSDFCAHAINRGLTGNSVVEELEFFFGHYPRDSYENLMLPMHLDRLENSLRRSL